MNSESKLPEHAPESAISVSLLSAVVASEVFPLDKDVGHCALPCEFGERALEGRAVSPFVQLNDCVLDLNGRGKLNLCWS